MLLSDFQAEMQDHGFTDTSTSRLNGFINDAYFDVVSREPWPSREKTVDLTTTASNETPSNIPTDFGPILSAVIDANYRVLVPERADVVQKKYVGSLSSTGVPIHYYQLGGAGTMRLYPIPDSVYTIRTRYLAQATAMSAAGDSPSLIPTRHHRVILLGALVMAYRMEDDDDLAEVFERQFNMRLQTMREDMWKSQYDRADRIGDVFDDGFWGGY